MPDLSHHYMICNTNQALTLALVSHLKRGVAAAVLELWELLGRFSGLLQLPETPAIEQLTKAITDGSGAREEFDVAMVTVSARSLTHHNFF